MCTRIAAVLAEMKRKFGSSAGIENLAEFGNLDETRIDHSKIDLLEVGKIEYLNGDLIERGRIEYVKVGLVDVGMR